MAFLMSEQTTTWKIEGRKEFPRLGEFSSGKMLHLKDMVFLLALPELSLFCMRLLHSHFQHVNLNKREDCSREPQRLCASVTVARRPAE